MRWPASLPTKDPRPSCPVPRAHYRGIPIDPLCAIAWPELENNPPGQVFHSSSIASQSLGRHRRRLFVTVWTANPHPMPAQRGYAAIPIMPGTKRPGFFCAGMWMGLTNWQMKFVGQAPSLFERQLWSKGDTGIGVVAGPASGGMIGADIDTDDSAIKAALSAVFPHTPATTHA